MSPSFTPISHSHDLTRDEIIARFRDRIAQEKRAKLYKDELGQLILHFIARLKQVKSAAEIQALCQAEIALLEEGYFQSTLASDYILKYRKAIEAAIESGTIPITEYNSHRYTHIQRVTGAEEERFEHYALTYFKYDQEVYESLDRRSADTNRNRQLDLQSVEPHSYLQKLRELLDAQGKFAVRLQAIAIAGVTGRRIGEVLARGRFRLSNHPYLLRFEGHQKTQVPAYDIVTLIEAQELLEYIEQFRSSDEIRPLLKLSGDALTGAINQLDVQINRECNKHLAGIVPPLAERDSISIHNLRSLWGAMAVWLFCPDNQHEYPFIQHYLGHAIDSNATGHYFRYQLVAPDGQLLRQKGIKLPLVGELPLFTDDAAAKATPDTTTPSLVTPAATETVSPNQEAAGDEAAAVTPPDTLPAACDPNSKVIKLSYYQRDRDRLMHLFDAVSPASSNQQQKMSAFLDWAEQQLQSASGDGESQDAPSRGDATAPALEGDADITDDKPPTSSTPAATSYSPLELLVTQAVADQARSLGVLASRVEVLEAQLSQLQQERDRAIAQLEAAQSVPTELQGQLESLQAENTHLRQECARFDAIRRAFLAESIPQSVTSAPDVSPGDSTSAVATTSTPAPATTDRTPAPASASASATTPADGTSNGASAKRSPGKKERDFADSPTKQQRQPKSSSTGAAASKSNNPHRFGKAKDRAESIFHAVVAWNEQHPDDTFAIVDLLLERTFHINRRAAIQFCADFHDAIAQHHAQIGITKERTHNRGKDTSALQEFALDFTGQT